MPGKHGGGRSYAHGPAENTQQIEETARGGRFLHRRRSHRLVVVRCILTPTPATVLAWRLNAAVGTQVRTSEAPQAALLAAVDAVLVLLAILAAIGAVIEQIDACAVAELQALGLLSCPSGRRDGRRRRRWQVTVS